MRKVRTHYDNLKVARDAPVEVIRAAYKSLSQKYHPDKNPGNAEAARIASIINESYRILSDPDKRKTHDLWITEQELQAPQSEGGPNRYETKATASYNQRGNHHYPGTSPIPEQHRRPFNFWNKLIGIVVHVFRYWILYVFASASIWIWLFDEPSRYQATSSKPYQAYPPKENLNFPKPTWQPEKPAYVKPRAAPNGQPWPTKADYVKGYQKSNMTGLSTVTIDNSMNDSDVFVKLVFLDASKAYPVRQIYIPAFGKFTLNKVTTGNYDIRYRDLNTGELSRSEEFRLEEIPTYNGTQYSNITMTLYKVQNGNMQTYEISEADF